MKLGVLLSLQVLIDPKYHLNIVATHKGMSSRLLLSIESPETRSLCRVLKLQKMEICPGQQNEA